MWRRSPCARHESILGVGVEVQIRPFLTSTLEPACRRIRNWVGCSLDYLEKIKLSCLCRESYDNFVVVRPLAWTLYWTNYLDSEAMFVCFWGNSPQWARVSSFMKFLDHKPRRTTVGRTPLDEWSARRIELYLTTPNTRNRKTSMPTVGFEPSISKGERPQTYALDRAATGTGHRLCNFISVQRTLCRMGTLIYVFVCVCLLRA
jgi:hypothetical protein